LMNVVKAKDGNNETMKQFMLSSGMASSALEHSVPEKLFSTPEQKAEGISAVKALQIANDQGIPIYTVNQTNISTVLPQLQVDQQVKEDIQNAVNAGKVVTVSKTNINVNGWSGCGYIIINPETGAGAYMISGGTNGGFMYIFWTVMWVLAWTTLIVAATVFVILLAAILAPLIGALLATLATAITEFAILISDIYLAASIRLASYPLIMALYADLMAWGDMSPPPLPIPTDPVQAALFIWMYFRIYLVNELIPLLRSSMFIYTRIYISSYSSPNALLLLRHS